MATETTVRATRYEAIIATLVGVSALFVSGYTAYVQRQQVRATVWPILEYSTSNDPRVRFVVANKGVGPAIIGHVLVRVDGEPVRTWNQALRKLIGPGEHHFTQSTISGHTFSPGESMDVMTPHDSAALDRERGRVAVEICYCSTLGDCWTLRSGRDGNSTTETRTCPEPSASTFQE